MGTKAWTGGETEAGRGLQNPQVCVVLRAGTPIGWTVPPKCGLDRRGVGRGAPFAVHTWPVCREGALPATHPGARACSLLSSGHISGVHHKSCPTCVHPWLPTHRLPTRAVRVPQTFGAAISGQRWPRRAGAPGIEGMSPSCPTCSLYSSRKKLRPRDRESLCWGPDFKPPAAALAPHAGSWFQTKQDLALKKTQTRRPRQAGGLCPETQLFGGLKGDPCPPGT